MQTPFGLHEWLSTWIDRTCVLPVFLVSRSFWIFFNYQTAYVVCLLISSTSQFKGSTSLRTLLSNTPANSLDFINRFDTKFLNCWLNQYLFPGGGGLYTSIIHSRIPPTFNIKCKGKWEERLYFNKKWIYVYINYIYYYMCLCVIMCLKK